MPRQLRQFEIGNVYHIVNRGVEKRDIFLKNQDYSRFVLGLFLFNDKNFVDVWQDFLRYPGKGGNRGGTVPPLLRAWDKGDRKPFVELLAFALMPNHYHLILREIQEKGISEFMRKLGGYSTYFNKQYDRVGSLFQSRYKAVEVTTDEQLMNVFVYVHTNPVGLIEKEWKDGKVKNYEEAIKFLDSYRWSSYPDYIGKKSFPKVTEQGFYLDIYGGHKNCEDAVREWVEYKAASYKPGSEIIE